MPDNRRFKGRSPFLEVLLGGIAEGFGSNVVANPEAKLAQDAIDRGVVEKGGAEEAAVRSGAQDKPFKGKNIFATPNANRLNTDLKVADIQRQGNENSQIRVFAKQAEIELDKAEKMGIISNQQKLQLQQGLDSAALQFERDKIPIEVEREKQTGAVRSKQDVDTTRKKERIQTKQNRRRVTDEMLTRNDIAATPENLVLYNTVNALPAITAKQTQFGRQQAENTEASKRAELGSRITDATADQSVNNAEWIASKLQRDKEADYVRGLLMPLGTGQNIVDVRQGNIVAKGPSEFGDLNIPGMNTGQQLTQQPQGGMRTMTSDGRPLIQTRNIPQASTAQPIQSEQATDVIQQAPPRPKPKIDGWEFVNGRWQYTNKQPRVTPIPGY